VAPTDSATHLLHGRVIVPGVLGRPSRKHVHEGTELRFQFLSHRGPFQQVLPVKYLLLETVQQRRGEVFIGLHILDNDNDAEPPVDLAGQ
jgi:hypothetical protein